MAYQKKTWTNDISELSAENFNPMEEGIFGAYPVQLIAIDSTAPSTCATGDKYYNTTSKKIFTATGTNTWGTNGETPLEDTAYWLISENGSYAWNGTDLVSIGGGKAEVVISDEEPEEGKIWVNPEEEIPVIAGREHLVQVSNEVDEDYRVNLLYSKNLFDINSMVELIGAYRAFGQGQIVQSASYNGLKIPVKSNTTYTITINANYSNITYWDNSFTRIGGEAFSHSGGSGTFTTPSGCFYITLAVQNNYTQIMLNEGSTALPYEEFIPNQIVVNNEKYSDTLNVGASVDSRNRVNILKSNNLLDLQFLQLMTNSSGTVISNNNCWDVIIDTRNINSLYVSGNFSLLADNTIRVGTYSSYPVLGSTGTRLTLQANGTINTSNVNYVLLAFGMSSSSVTIDQVKASFMINEGSTALPYEPYITPSIYVDNEEIYTKPNIVQLLGDTIVSVSTSYALSDSIQNYKYLMVCLTSATLFENANRQYIPVEQIQGYSINYRIGMSVFQSTSVYMFVDLYFSDATHIYCNGKTQGGTGWTPHIKVYGIK